MLSVSSGFNAAAESIVRETKARITLLFTDSEYLENEFNAGDGASANTNAGITQLSNHAKEFYTHQWARISPNTCLDNFTFGELESFTFSGLEQLYYKRNPNQSPLYWELGVSYIPPYEEDSPVEYGYWSKEVSNASGNFSGQNAVYLEFENEVNLPTLKLYFDNDPEQYATGFNLYKKSAEQGADYVLIYSATNNTEQELKLILNEQNVKELKLVPISWSKSYEPFRLLEFEVFGDNITINDDELFSVKVIESCEEDGVLSFGTRTLEVSVNNENDIILKSYVIPNIKILAEMSYKLEDGSYEWVSAGLFYTTEFLFEKANKKVNITAVDILTLYDDISIENQFTLNYTDPAAAIEQMVSRTNAIIPSVEYSGEAGSIDIDDYLVEPKTLREAVFELANNLCCGVYTKRDGSIYICNSAISGSVYTLTPDSTKQGGVKTTLIKQLNTVTAATKNDDYIDSFQIDYQSHENAKYTLSLISENLANLQTAMSVLENYFLTRKIKNDIECRGNVAVEIGDTVKFISKTGEIQYGILTKAEYTYSGALKAKWTLKSQSISDNEYIDEYTFNQLETYFYSGLENLMFGVTS